MNPFRLTLIALLVLALADFVGAEAGLDYPTLSGNGGLTLQLDSEGALRHCAWPSPGYYPHLAGSPEKPGACWRIHLAFEAAPLQASKASTREQVYLEESPPVIVTRLEWAAQGCAVEQRLFVHPEKDLLVIRLIVKKSPGAYRLFWHQNFKPSTRLLPECVDLIAYLPEQQGFALFQDCSHQRSYGFRPRNPGKESWRKARAALDHPQEAGAWTGFEAGVWIGCATPNVLEGYTCAAPEVVRDALARQELQGPDACIGNSALAWEIESKPMEEAILYFAFGESRDHVDALLDWAQERGYAALEQESVRYWRAWLQSATASLLDASLKERFIGDLFGLALRMDKESGAIALERPNRPTWSVDEVEKGPWISAAWAATGYVDEAMRHCRFYAKAIRNSLDRATPQGSFSRAYYSNGTEAAPSMALDMILPARVLASFFYVVGSLPESDRDHFITSILPAIRLAGDSLASWRDAHQGAPLPSYDPAVYCDQSRAESTLFLLMGIQCAIRLVDSLGETVPDSWREAQQDLETLIRFELLNEQEVLRISPLDSFWLREVFPPTALLWDLRTGASEGNVQRLRDLSITNAEFLSGKPVPREESPSVVAALRLLAASGKLYTAPTR